MLGEHLTGKWQKLVRDYCDSTYELIEVEAGDIHYNYKCHLNATHYALKNDDEKLVLCTYRQGDKLIPCVHFINYHDGKYIDNTIGEWASATEYRFIGFVSKKEFYDTPLILQDTQNKFKRMATPLQRLCGTIKN